MPAAASPAVVVDVEADMIPTPNGAPKWLRLVLKPQAAQELLTALQQQLSGEAK